MSNDMGGRGRRTSFLLGAALAGALLAGWASPVHAQYFGRNKVQYDEMDFRILETPHFDVHYYPSQEEAIQDVTRMSERWYERLARLFQHEFEERKPLIFYADHPDFQQTNTLPGFIGEGTGGVTESLKDRVIMPLAGSYAATNHVLGHELVHAFQFNVAKAQNRRGQGGVNGFVRLPLWLVEGMAEYISVGREDSHTAMWMRDALLTDEFPTIEQLTTDSRFFPYRFGQALWAYIGGTYGDRMVLDLFRRSLRSGFEPAISALLGVSPDTLSAEWRRRVEQAYLPLMEGRQAPADLGTALLSPETGSGTMNVSPALSPDGRFIAFLSEKDLFSIDLFLADARTGQVIRKLSSETSDTHFDALAFTETAGTFSPDGSQFVFVVFAGGDNEMIIVETQGGDVERTVKTPGIGAIMNPSWSPDGTRIAFTGIAGGVSDLYVYDVETEEIVQLTADRNADYHPSWSPDGRRIVFASDRGPETDFEQLTFSDFRLALIDVDSRAVEVIDVFGNVRHSNPHFSPDGRSVYFLSDQDGFSDIYRLALETGTTERITRLKTGVSGITSDSPALSVAARTGELAFSVFSESGFHVYTLPADPAGTPVARMAAAETDEGRLLPPATPLRESRVAEFLADPITGLQPASAFPVSSSRDYDGKLELDQIGQPYFGGSAGRYGYYVSAGASAFFSDMLGNRQLAVALNQQGTLKDIGGQILYADLSDRWNWAVMGGRVPYQLAFAQFEQDEGDVYLRRQLLRIFETGVGGQIAYPLSTTRRMEMGLALQRYSFDLEEERWFLDPSATFYTGEREKTDIDQPCEGLTEEQRLLGIIACKPTSLNMVQSSLAYVGDNSFFGLTSPIRGGRFRLGVEATVGTENFVTATADVRRYFSPHQNLTIAVRGMHTGRWGAVGSDAIQPMYLGNETLIRGYALDSFRPDECQASLIQAGDGATSTCPTFSRLIGHRLAVANVELRVPLFGSERYGLINLPFIGTELALFADAGVAWDSENPAKFEISRSSVDRVPVFSVGASARFNLFGMLILEAYHANPFQRPFRGRHWGFVLSPGW